MVHKAAPPRPGLTRLGRAGRAAGLALLAAAVAACGGAETYRRDDMQIASPGDASFLPVAASAQGRGKRGVQEGRASYYADSFRGRKTASGERYDPRRFTAAHKTLPLGTQVRVTRMPQGPSVVVKVNDRCGCTHGRIIDLSEAAARKLDMLRVGVVPVRIEILGHRASDEAL